MNDQFPTPKLSQAGQATLENFFMDKIMALAQKSSVDYSIEKQRQIDASKEEAIIFVKTNPYAKIEVVVLSPKCDEHENFEYGIIIKNFEHFMENGKKPTKYGLIINHTWSNFTILQRSIDDKFWTQL